MKLIEVDNKILVNANKINLPLAKLSVFVVYFWFGILKVLNLSPASTLVQQLFNKTIPVIDFNYFFIAFGLFECLIGILFLIKRLERIAILVCILHLFTTFLTLVLLKTQMWNGILIPTLEGQYVIKNVLIISALVNITSKINK